MVGIATGDITELIGGGVGGRLISKFLLEINQLQYQLARHVLAYIGHSLHISYLERL